MTFDEWYEQNAKYMNTTDFEAWMLEAWEAGAKNEREACAKVCDDIDTDSMIQNWKSVDECAKQCAAAIRARGENGTA